MPRLGLVAAVLGLAFAASASAAPVGEPTTDPAAGQAIAAEINAVRAENGLVRLRIAAGLSRAARDHALSMASQGYFSHSSADGSSQVRRIAAYYPVKGATSWAVGEVMAWSVGTLAPSRAIQMWLASSLHRTELLQRRWRQVGVGVVHARAPGVFGGRNVTIVVVDFGVRR